jgi:Recombination endonuclease VII
MPQECAICGSEENLHIDHDHNTGKIRALLCRSCNIGLGHFKDEPSLLVRGVDYLMKNYK